MVMSPTQQVSKSQRGTVQLPVEPDAEIVLGRLGGQQGETELGDAFLTAACSDIRPP